MGNQMEFKQISQLIDIFRKEITRGIANTQIPCHYYGIVKNVYGDETADIELNVGTSPTLLEKLRNKSGVILQTNDMALISAPHGNLTDCFIDKCCNPLILINAEHIKGTLRVGGIDNSDGSIILMSDDGNSEAIELKDYSVKFFDWQSEGSQTGEIGSYRHTNSDGSYGSACMDLVAEKNCSIILSTRNDDGTTADGGIELSNNAYNDGKMVYISTECSVNPSNGNHGVDISDAGNQVYNHTHCNQWDIDNVGNMKCVNLDVSGGKHCVQGTEHFSDRLYYSFEMASSWLGDCGHGKITDGQCLIYFDPIFVESINMTHTLFDRHEELVLY